MSVLIRWAGWHGDAEHELDFRSTCQVVVYPMAGAAGATLADVKQAHRGDSDSSRRVIAELTSRR